MTRPNTSSGETAQPTTPKRPTKDSIPPTTPRTPISSPNTPRKQVPRNAENSCWVFEQKRRAYVGHLKAWSRNHDSSNHFEGTISIWKPERQSESLDLGKSVKCVLSDKKWTDARKHIIIRLFAPATKDGRYRLVVRSGAGWLTSREFLSKEHLVKLRVQRRLQGRSLMEHLQREAGKLSAKPEEKDVIAIQPLFLPFVRLPVELQHHIFQFAICKTDLFRPARDRVGFAAYAYHNRESRSLKTKRRQLDFVNSRLKLSPIFRISKSLNEHLIPWIYQTTSFHFETQGFTNFMWLAGPINRRYIRQVTLAFGHYALLHCIRWLAPDPIFELFDPPMSLRPQAMQYFWRCQIRDLVQELHLNVLTIDVKHVPADDYPFISRILRECFASVGRVRYVYAGEPICMEDSIGNSLIEHRSWSELCLDAFQRYRNREWHCESFNAARIAGSAENLKRDMEKRLDFFWS